MVADAPRRRLRVFLCHASADKPRVRKLCNHLEGEGFDPWLDEDRLLPGQEWSETIQAELRSSDAVIVCLSPESVAKDGYVQKEIRYALDAADEKREGSIFIIPVKLDECSVPSRLGRFQWVELFAQDGLTRLGRALRYRASQLRIETEAHSVASVLEELNSIPLMLGRLWYYAVFKRPELSTYRFTVRPYMPHEQLGNLQHFHRQAFNEWVLYNLQHQIEELRLFISAADNPTEMLEYLSAGGYLDLVPLGTRRVDTDCFIADIEVALELIRTEYGLRVLGPTDD